MNHAPAPLLDLVDRMPAFPQAVTRILELTASANVAPKDLVQVIEHDPVMTMRILKLVNSAHFGLASTVKSINHGVVIVGVNTIKNLALAIAALGALPRDNQAGLDMDQFLLHSLGVGTVSRVLASRIGTPEKRVTDFFVAGLLHDFGKVVLAQFLPEQYRHALEQAADGKTSLRRAEQQIFGADHTEIGGLLAESWHLPPVFAAAIRGHHGQGTDEDTAPVRDCVFAANQIVRFYRFGASGNPIVQALPGSVAGRFGHDLPGLVRSLGDLRPELEQARIFISP